MTPSSPSHAGYGSCLLIEKLQLSVKLGLHDHERTLPIPVELDVRFYFGALPECCGDDSLPSICYDDYASRIKSLAESREFKLVEYLTLEIYRLLRGSLDKQYPGREIALWLKARKTVLPVPYGVGGASFIYSDLPPGAPAICVE